MDYICKNCGKALAQGTAFCTECGTKTEMTAEQPQPAPIPQPVPSVPVTEPFRPQPTAGPAAVPIRQAAPDPAVQVVGTGTFFGLQFLFGIPVIGWIACLLMSFLPQNKNIRHYARAALIWLLIGAVLAVGLYFLTQWLFEVAADIFAQLTEGIFGDLGGLDDIFGQIGGTGDLGELLGQLGGSGELGELLGQLGENGQLGDLTGLLGQLGKENDLGALTELMDKLGEGNDLGDLNELLDQYGDLSGVLEQIENGMAPTNPTE